MSLGCCLALNEAPRQDMPRVLENMHWLAFVNTPSASMVVLWIAWSKRLSQREARALPFPVLAVEDLPASA